MPSKKPSRREQEAAEVAKLLDDDAGWLTEFQSETERGAAVLCAAFLDSSIEALIKSYLVDDPKELDRLFDPDMPLSGFVTRARMAYALGLLTKGALADIKVLAKIRNMFAHKLHGLTFKTPVVARECRKLGAPKIMPADVLANLSLRMQYQVTAAIIERQVAVKRLEVKRDGRLQAANPVNIVHGKMVPRDNEEGETT